MDKPILVLQYPDPLGKRTIALAATRDWGALRAFKHAALADARLSCVRWDMDSLLRQHGEVELRRLENLFNLLLPEDVGEGTVDIE